MSGAATSDQSETCVYCSFGRERRGRGRALPVGEVAEQQVVGVVPGPGAAEAVELVVRVDVEAVLEEGRPDALEGEAQVARGAPAVAADLASPLPDLPHPVLAEVEDDVAGLPLQDRAHLPVRLLERLDARLLAGDLAVRAPVVLQEVEAPLDEARRVLLLVLVRADVARARLRPGRRCRCPP